LLITLSAAEIARQVVGLGHHEELQAVVLSAAGSA
jgi:hypothetical protein